VQDRYKIAKLVDGKTVDSYRYSEVFLYPMGAALVGAVLLALFFHPPKGEVKE
jgi:hypothetical protein